MTDAELSLATDYLVGVFPIRFETTAEVAGGLANVEIFRLPSDYFDNYREGMAKADAVLLGHPTQRADADRYSLTARAHLGGFQPDAPWPVSLSAVIEETSGRKSYWALAHPPGKPDFHHPDSFACVLEPS